MGERGEQMNNENKTHDGIGKHHGITHASARPRWTYLHIMELPLSPPPPLPREESETLGVLYGGYLETRAHALV